jgi:hypothetical protein
MESVHGKTSETQRFVVDCQDRPQIVEICAKLKRLYVQMKNTCYMPNTKFVLHDVDEEERLIHLCHHNKKLAIASRLINRPPSATFHILESFTQ